MNEHNRECSERAVRVQGGPPVQRSGCLVELARVGREEELLGCAPKLPELNPNGRLHGLVRDCRQHLR